MTQGGEGSGSVHGAVVVGGEVVERMGQRERQDRTKGRAVVFHGENFSWARDGGAVFMPKSMLSFELSLGSGVGLEAHVLARLLLMPLRDLLEGLGECVDDDGGFAAAEAFDGLLGGLVGIVGGVPEANDDAVFRQVRTNALADGAGLGEGEGREGRDEDDGVGLCGERVEDLA